MKKGYTIQDLRDGKCAVINDGSLDELQLVVRHAFPRDEMIVSGMSMYYYRDNKNPHLWVSNNVTGLVSQSVKLFIPKTFDLESVSKMFFDLIRHIPEGELRKWGEQDFASFIESIEK